MSALAIRERLKKKILPAEGYSGGQIAAMDQRIGNFFAWISHRDLSITKLPSTVVEDYVGALTKQGVALDEVNATLFALTLLFKFAPGVDGAFDASGVVIPTTVDRHAERAERRSGVTDPPIADPPITKPQITEQPPAVQKRIFYDLIGTSETAKILGIDRTYVKTLVDNGELECAQETTTNIGVVRRFERSAVLALRAARDKRGVWRGSAFEKIVDASPEAEFGSPKPIALVPAAPSPVEAVVVSINKLTVVELSDLNSRLRKIGLKLISTNLL